MEPRTRMERSIAFALRQIDELPPAHSRMDHFLNELAETVRLGGSTPEELQDAVDDYLTRNPVQAMTDEQIAESVNRSMAAGKIEGSVTTQAIDFNGVNHPVGTSLEEIILAILDFLQPYEKPTVTLSLNPSTTLYDVVTQTLPAIKMTANVTKKTEDVKQIDFLVNDVVKQSVTAGVASGGSFSYTFTPPADTNTNTTFKVVVKDIKDGEGASTKVVKFVANSYYGIVDDGVNPNEALVKNMNKVLKDVKGHKYAGITTNYGKVCYAYPSSFGALTSIKDLVNNINYTASFNQTTMTIDGIEYFMYLQIDPSAANNVEITFA